MLTANGSPSGTGAAKRYQSSLYPQAIALIGSSVAMDAACSNVSLGSKASLQLPSTSSTSMPIDITPGCMSTTPSPTMKRKLTNAVPNGCTSAKAGFSDTKAYSNSVPPSTSPEVSGTPASMMGLSVVLVTSVVTGTSVESSGSGGGTTVGAVGGRTTISVMETATPGSLGSDAWILPSACSRPLSPTRPS